MINIKEEAKKALDEIRDNLENGIIPFWFNKAIDKEFGGYLTNFDESGNMTDDLRKQIVTQTRMIWGLSACFNLYPDKNEYLEGAKNGFEFFKKYFWDPKYGGWYWMVERDGTLIDDGKVVYGQSFAIYALSEYYLASKDPEALKYAEDTFDLLTKYCLDSYRGGYYENLENDWSVSEPGFAAGDRKSLDIHMHLMEAFTTLYKASGKEIHKRRLLEVIDIILNRMINKKSGCGLNQFDVEFNPIPAINIRRTWNAERATGEEIATPTDTTSYGHNVELSWLLNRACEVMDLPFDTYHEYNLKLVEHSLKYGLDYELGGVYRDGLHEGNPLVYDKEWWQNCEVLVGYLDAYEHFKDERYFEAFKITWDFDNKYFINHELGEWKQLLDKKGNPIVADIGNPWKAIYHTGRAMMECVMRLEQIISE